MNITPPHSLPLLHLPKELSKKYRDRGPVRFTSSTGLERLSSPDMTPNEANEPSCFTLTW